MLATILLLATLAAVLIVARIAWQAEKVKRGQTIAQASWIDRVASRWGNFARIAAAKSRVPKESAVVQSVAGALRIDQQFDRLKAGDITLDEFAAAIDAEEERIRDEISLLHRARSKACGHLRDSFFRADRIQDWRRERHLGSTRIKRRAVGAGSPRASR